MGLRKTFEGFASRKNYSLVVGGRREGEVKNKFGDMEELFTNRTYTRNRVRCRGRTTSGLDILGWRDLRTFR